MGAAGVPERPLHTTTDLVATHRVPPRAILCATWPAVSPPTPASTAPAALIKKAGVLEQHMLAGCATIYLSTTWYCTTTLN